MTAIKVTNLTKAYNKSKFDLSINNLVINEGSIFSLLGPNGAGKTTFLKILLNLIKDYKGNVNVYNYDANDRNNLNSLISYMPENKNLYENMSIAQMIHFAKNVVPNFDIKKAHELFTLFPLKTTQKISTLSYGEKTQLYTIITFAKPAKLFILDEPTRGLDPVMQERLLSVVRDESTEGKTIVFSSHQISEVEEISDSTAIIKNGSIILNGNVDDLKEQLSLIVLNNDDLDLLKSTSIKIASIRTQEHNNYILLKGSKKELTTLQNVLPRSELVKPNLKDIFLNSVEGRRVN
ncbi:Efflux ABC transporter, ATP-binding protein [Candidatus Syntrophocurvum alkaliphilum]|uniref:Efflux ABC transporter, ATP-binding protein n=1 Tax=Candidatus Syntrophocurvum alkaliphilum TaxID=2293317 RepID=A0A6I6DI14_9FIRM|nr:ABC transporter ATP-binding protein [Candidatus Syntrophocurvum alkaliphilum]QGU00713.1 Efflux ABC transporter, ATP-binding protein [Candidatus Syntrophocurvum alkaliphilum]